MGSTFLSLHYHITFSTKDRRAWMLASWRDRLHAYLGGTIRGLGGVAESVGGVEDHVHLLVGFTHTLADIVREVKKAGTAWVHKEKLEPDFAWQEGHAAFTVSPTARAQVRQYIDNQEEHHRRRTYVEELQMLLEKAGVTYDPKYLE